MSVEIEMKFHVCGQGHVYGVPEESSDNHSGCPFCLKRALDYKRNEVCEQGEEMLRLERSNRSLRSINNRLRMKAKK